MDKFVKCRNCEHKSKLDIKLPECWYYTSSPMARECSKHRDWRLSSIAYKMYIKNGFNREWFEHNFIKDYKGSISVENVIRLGSYLRNFVKDEPIQGSMLYIYGKNGTQKTVTISALSASLIKKGIDVKYITMKQLVRLLQDEAFKEEAKLVVESLHQYDLLIIDEAFDKNKMLVAKSGWHNSFIDDFCKTRISNRKGIIFISNVKIENIQKEGFTLDIQEFIKRETDKYDSFLEFSDKYLFSKLPDKIF